MVPRAPDTMYQSAPCRPVSADTPPLEQTPLPEPAHPPLELPPKNSTITSPCPTSDTSTLSGCGRLNSPSLPRDAPSKSEENPRQGSESSVSSHQTSRLSDDHQSVRNKVGQLLTQKNWVRTVVGLMSLVCTLVAVRYTVRAFSLSIADVTNGEIQACLSYMQLNLTLPTECQGAIEKGPSSSGYAKRSIQRLGKAVHTHGRQSLQRIYRLVPDFGILFVVTIALLLLVGAIMLRLRPRACAEEIFSSPVRSDATLQFRLKDEHKGMALLHEEPVRETRVPTGDKEGVRRRIYENGPKDLRDPALQVSRQPKQQIGNSTATDKISRSSNDGHWLLNSKNSSAETLVNSVQDDVISQEKSSSEPFKFSVPGDLDDRHGLIEIDGHSAKTISLGLDSDRVTGVTPSKDNSESSSDSYAESENNFQRPKPVRIMGRGEEGGKRVREDCGILTV